ncbi:hypothetical protein LUZ60_012536 [Juncus effusus]|nr:hypothetical protein LUZ60_012536 [Juncus effusus]
MAAPALLSSSSVLSSRSPFRDKCSIGTSTEARNILFKRNHFVVSCSSQRNPSLNRRDLVLLGLTSSFALSVPNSDLHAIVDLEKDVKMNSFKDDINAYSYMYPTEDGKLSFKWVESRKPERYSSAAPLSPDARQRIVSERVDMIHNMVITVSIGPPNLLFLPQKEKVAWKPKDVADAILSDKTALKITAGQRLNEISVIDAHSNDIEGEPYWYYEYLIRKSPTGNVQGPNLFRHSVAVTAERDGYLYSLNASALSKRWEEIGPSLEKAVASFRLINPTENYVPPYKDPWRFW